MLNIYRASAGSGKTYRLTQDYIHLLFDPQKERAHRRILAVTFTNKAAKEMRERIQAALTGAEQPPLITTFHALGARILRQEGHLSR